MRTTLARTAWAVPALMLGLSGAMAQNAYLQDLSLSRFIKAGQNMPLSVKCRNASSTPYTTCSVSWKLDGGATNTMANLNIGGGGIVLNNFLPLTHPVQLNASQGPHVIKMWINTTIDTDHSNDTLTVAFTALTTWADKVVLLEGRTETWCQYCPPANAETNTLMANPDFAVVKFHLSDEYDFPDGNAYYAQYNINFTPAGMIDLGEYDTYVINSNYNQWEDALVDRALGVSPVELSLNSSMNWTTRVLTVTLNAEFTYAMSGPFKMNVYLAEDNIAGTQTNAPGNYIHNGVMRAMLGGSAGTSGVIPNTPVVGTTYSETYTYTVPAGFKLGDLRLVGLVEHDAGASGRYCVNAVNSKASPVGVAEQSLGSDRLNVYPNPFVDQLRITAAGLTGNAQVELVAMDGRMLVQQNVVLDGTGTATLECGDANLASGTYLLRLTTSAGTAERHVLKMD